jgi:ubiquitin carboxyl-terminal hydrolase 8
MEDVPSSPRARASTYTNVHEAVMYNLSEAERSKHDKSVPMGVIGLKNLGNTCFINSSLQCLSATIPLTDYFLGYDYRSEINKENFLGTGGELVFAYAELMKRMWMGNRSVVEPSDFKEKLSTFAPQFGGYHQHDSQELLSYLLDGIHEDLNRVKTRPFVEDKDCDGTHDEQDAIDAWKNYLKRNKSLVVDLFQGQLRNTCKCLVCSHMNIRFEPFMYLSLPINDKCKSLDDCIDLYVEQEILQGTNQWYCEKCKKHVDATKKSDLWILPPILIVHLKRFKYNDNGKAGSKNDQPISYPMSQWDLKHHVKNEKGIYPMYDLYAVSNHIGGLGGGHYKATTLNRFDDLWYEFDDTAYKTITESKHKEYAKSAYVLFYNRSEGDASVPLNDRSPIIRRQSVSRPDLWPHTQMDDRTQVRNFTRSSRRASDGVSAALDTRLDRTGSMDPVRGGAGGTDNGGRPGGPRLKRPPVKCSPYMTRSRIDLSADRDTTSSRSQSKQIESLSLKQGGVTSPSPEENIPAVRASQRLSRRSKNSG